MSDGTGRQARQGAVLAIGTQAAKQILSVTATVVLARILTPSDFGIVAAANSLIGLAAIGTTLGFGPSVVRREEAGHDFLSTVFWSGVAISTVLAAAVAALSPLLAAAFGRPDAAAYVAVLAPTLIFDVTAAVPLSLLQRQLRFTAMYGVLTAAMAVYVAVQIILAVAGFGPWAVIIGQLAMGCSTLTGAMVMARWRPGATFHLSIVRSELGFAGGILGGQVLSYGVKNADFWLVGRTFAGPALGAYYIAFTLPNILRQRMSNASRQVLFPVFARERSDADRTASIYNTTMRLQIALGVPAMVGLAALAAPVTAVFFGHQWDAAIEPMRWLALASVFEIITSSPGSIAIAQGRLNLYLSSLAGRLALMVAVLVAAIAAGADLEAFALAMLGQSAGGALVTQLLVARPLGLSSRCIVRPLLVAAGPSAAMYAVVAETQARLAWTDPALLALCVPLGVIVYVALLRLFFRNELTFLRHQLRAIVASVTKRRRPAHAGPGGD